MLKRICAVFAVFAMALVGAVAAPSAANAATARNGVCESGEFCLYYNSDYAGSVSDFSTSVSDYGSSLPSCYVFKGTGAGRGLCVKNQAASAVNKTGKPVTVFYNSGYAGASQTIPAGGRANLNASLKNENASHRIGSSSTATTRLSYALYKASGGYISCGYDGYQNTDGRHEGIDIKRSNGSKVYALVAGRVVRVTEGANGSGGLSTIAIYNAATDKTVVYLHSDPIVKKDQVISRGQLIAYEAWRGVSSSGAGHTHVEVRPGLQTSAAKSVGDYTLSNPNPTSFWNARGYIVG